MRTSVPISRCSAPLVEFSPGLGERRRNCRGVALLELAILITVLSFLAGGAINYGWMFYEHGVLVDVAKDSARYAATTELNQTIEARGRANLLLARIGLTQSDYSIDTSCEELFPADSDLGTPALLTNSPNVRNSAKGSK